jgi:hypothetical protein
VKQLGHDSGNPESVRKLTLLNGFQVGIINLYSILGEVAGLKLTDTRIIETELLKKVKACNYVPSSAENDYSSALLREYELKFEISEDKHRVEPKKSHAR